MASSKIPKATAKTAAQPTAKAKAKVIPKAPIQVASLPLEKKRRTPPKIKTLAPQGLLKGKHVVCFWKQNDLGLYGRRPDRWIQLWEQDPQIEKIVVFEMPLSTVVLQEWLNRAVRLDPVSGSEYRLLLDQSVAKLQGQCDTAKTTYKTYLPAPDKTAANQDYLNWVLQQIEALGVQNPSLVLWPACFVNEALIKKINPCQIVTDIIDDQRLFPANAQLVATITTQYATWLKLSDVVVCNSEQLIASLDKEFGRKISHLSNASLEPVSSLKPRVQRKSTKPQRTVIGYVGNMRERMDTQALVQTIQSNPDKDFWFVGHTHTSDFYAKARELSNCKFWGTLRQAEAEQLVVQFDMDLISFLDNALALRSPSMKKVMHSKLNTSQVSVIGLTPKAKAKTKSSQRVKLV